MIPWYLGCVFMFMLIMRHAVCTSFKQYSLYLFGKASLYIFKCHGLMVIVINIFSTLHVVESSDIMLEKWILYQTTVKFRSYMSQIEFLVVTIYIWNYHMYSSLPFLSSFERRESKVRTKNKKKQSSWSDRSVFSKLKALMART